MKSLESLLADRFAPPAVVLLKTIDEVLDGLKLSKETARENRRKKIQNDLEKLPEELSKEEQLFYLKQQVALASNLWGAYTPNALHTIYTTATPQERADVISILRDGNTTLTENLCRKLVDYSQITQRSNAPIIKMIKRDDRLTKGQRVKNRHTYLHKAAKHYADIVAATAEKDIPAIDLMHREIVRVMGEVRGSQRDETSWTILDNIHRHGAPLDAKVKAVHDATSIIAKHTRRFKDKKDVLGLDALWKIAVLYPDGNLEGTYDEYTQNLGTWKASAVMNILQNAASSGLRVREQLSTSARLLSLKHLHHAQYKQITAIQDATATDDLIKIITNIEQFGDSPPLFDRIIAAYERVPQKARGNIVGIFDQYTQAHQTSLEECDEERLHERIGDFLAALPKLAQLPQDTSARIINRSTQQAESLTDILALDDLAHETRVSDKITMFNFYASMIAGRGGNVAVIGEENIGIKFDKKRKRMNITLPTTMTYFSKPQDNMRLCKAIVTLYAGHLRYGTFTGADGNYIDVSTLANTQENPHLFTYLIEVLDEARVRSRLRYDYPGMRTDLELLCTYLSQQSILSSNALQDIPVLRQLVEASLGNFSRSDFSPEVMRALSRVEGRDASFEDTLAAAHDIYELLPDKEFIRIHKDQVKHTRIMNMAQTALAHTAAQRETSEETTLGSRRYWYPEFDDITRQLVPDTVQVIENEPETPRTTPRLYASADPAILQQLLEEFEMIAPQARQTLHRRTHGKLSMRDYGHWLAQKRNGKASSRPTIFKQVRYSNRSVAAAIVLEHSGSGRKMLSGEAMPEMVADYMKLSADWLTRCITTLGDEAALFAYNGRGPMNVCVSPIMHFGEAYDEQKRNLLVGLEPNGNNRDGAVLRHIGTEYLANHPAKTRLLINITDGVPHDEGYEGEHARQDILDACTTLQQKEVYTLRLVVDPSLTDAQADALRDRFTIPLRDFKRAVSIIPQIYFERTN